MRALKVTLALALAVWALVTVYTVVLLRERYGRGWPIPVRQAGMLVHPLRRRLQPERRTLEKFRLRDGDTVLELGHGPGYFSVEASRMVGAGGRVVCVDLQPGMLALLRQRLDDEAVTNGQPLAGDAARLPLADGSVDAAFLVAVLGEIHDRPAALRELRRVMKRGGALSISESLTDPDYQLMDSVRDLCRASGFEVVGQSRDLLGYTLVFAAG